jgi:hypothetical protein
MLSMGAAQAQTVSPVPDISVWQLMGQDIPFLVANVLVVVVLIIVIVTVRRRYTRFYKIQREALDHRKVTDAQVLTQNQGVEELIARQYGVVNAHNQLALARADEALRISTETLAQITSMNQSIARMADRLDRSADTPG